VQLILPEEYPRGEIYATLSMPSGTSIDKTYSTKPADRVLESLIDGLCTELMMADERLFAKKKSSSTEEDNSAKRMKLTGSLNRSLSGSVDDEAEYDDIMVGV
jgi:hypothetical protein